MGSVAKQGEPYISPEEHEALERETGVRYEWYDGEVFAMAGGTSEHSRIAGNIYTSLDIQLQNSLSEPWNSDRQVKIVSRATVLYPDVTVSCPPYEHDTQHRNALLNPRVIIEVLSPSTAAYDRGHKFDLYRLIPALSDYILVASDHRLIEHFARQPNDTWLLTLARENNACIEIQSIGCRLCLDDVYRRLDLPTADEFDPDAPEKREP